MDNIILEVSHVSKKFKKGETFNKLRHLIPALSRNLFKKLKGISLEKGEFWALDDVSFQVKRGEALGIIGANGAGKSTVLKLLSNIMKPTKGTINIKGTLSSLIELGAGFHGELTGRENVFLYGTILGMKRKQIEQNFDNIVEFSGLKEWMDTPVKRYSSGMYARLGFSVAAHVNPDILLVDEVLSVGDWLFQNKCMKKMESILNSNSAVVFISHNLDSVSSLCKRCICLQQGKVVDSGSTHDVIDHYISSKSNQNNESSGLAELEKAVYISGVRIRNEERESANFTPGQNAWVDVEISCNNRTQNLTVAIVLKDQNLVHHIFQVDTDWVGMKPFSMEPGENMNITFELLMHLANGKYFLIVELLKVDGIAVDLDFSEPRTLIIHSGIESKGVTNLYPKIVMCKKHNENAGLNCANK